MSSADRAAEAHFGTLELGARGLSPKRGGAFAEAAVVCFEDCGHLSGVMMSVDGDDDRTLTMSWDAPHETSRPSWADTQEATENGAYGVAALLVISFTDYYISQRSFKGPGFDFWLTRTPSSALFQDALRLEVSGTRRGPREIAARVRQKRQQASVSAHTGIPSLVIVVDFTSPRSRMVTYA